MHTQIINTDSGFREFTFANRQPLPFVPLTADNADFGDYGDRIILASLGVFSIDSAKHRADRRERESAKAERDAAYVRLGLNRRAECQRIAREVKTLGLVPDGVWARSTGAYTRRVGALDAEVIANAQRIAA